MENNSERRVGAVLGGIALVLISGAFFFDIIGVFGFALAVVGMVAAVAGAILLCCLRPSEDQAQ